MYVYTLLKWFTYNNVILSSVINMFTNNIIQYIQCICNRYHSTEDKI